VRRLQETWVQHGSRVEAQGDSAEIERLLQDELEQVSKADAGWRMLYRRRTDGKL